MYMNMVHKLFWFMERSTRPSACNNCVPYRVKSESRASHIARDFFTPKGDGLVETTQNVAERETKRVRQKPHDSNNPACQMQIPSDGGDTACNVNGVSYGLAIQLITELLTGVVLNLQKHCVVSDRCFVLCINKPKAAQSSGNRVVTGYIWDPAHLCGDTESARVTKPEQKLAIQCKLEGEEPALAGITDDPTGQSRQTVITNILFVWAAGELLTPLTVKGYPYNGKTCRVQRFAACCSNGSNHMVNLMSDGPLKGLSWYPKCHDCTSGSTGITANQQEISTPINLVKEEFALSLFCTLPEIVRVPRK